MRIVFIVILAWRIVLSLILTARAFDSGPSLRLSFCCGLKVEGKESVLTLRTACRIVQYMRKYSLIPPREQG